MADDKVEVQFGARTGAKSGRCPIYFTAEDIRMGRGERSHD